MDVLAGFLDGPRARGAFLLRLRFTPPWGVRVADDAPLTVMVVLAGQAWVVPDGGEAFRLDAGDVGIARGPGHYTLGDDPATPPQAVALPGGGCAPLGDGADHPTDLGVREWGTDPHGATTLLVGSYFGDGDVGRRLLDALPPMLHLPAPDTPVVDLLAAEIGRVEIGQEAVLDRLLDLLLVAVLRDWFARPGVHAPQWVRAHRDPVAGAALRLLHEDPVAPWTVGSLARAVGVSRAVLARRFAAAVGEPPMAYLTGWRLALAADLLRDPDATLAAVARKVGYGSPFALSAAFKRVRGVSPRHVRAG
jgi:AraC-like DNA-binding protein